jgi:hypothetical protein
LDKPYWWFAKYPRKKMYDDEFEDLKKRFPWMKILKLKEAPAFRF